MDISRQRREASRDSEYEAPEVFEVGDAAELTFGGCGCWTDSDTEYGEEDADGGGGVFQPGL